MKASDLFVRCLENEGVRQIFGVPGEENADLMMSLEDSSIEFVLTRHEQGAAFMAEVHGRLTGEAGVCLGTLGPGATNLITGVADSNMDRAPLVVLTGQADSQRQHKESHQYMDVVAMFDPVTKWAQAVLHPDNIPEILRKAFKLATTEKPGACHVELAEDVAAADAVGAPLPVVKTRRPVPGDKALDRALAVIQSARRPIILAGNGCVRKRASKQLRRFAEFTGIGVVSTFMAKGCVDMDSEQCLFTVGLQSKDIMMCAMDAADVVICVGYDMVEYPPRLWNPDRNTRIVNVDFQPAEIDAHFPVEVDVVGDVAHALWALNERVKAEPIHFDQTTQKAARRDMLEELALHADDDTEGSIRPQKVLWDVRRVMGPLDIVLSDVGAHKMWIARHYQCHEPNTCLIPNGFCSMGFALPGAIAAHRVFPDRRVLAICGDAGFLMNCQEIETALRIGTAIIILIWNDNEYGLIRWHQLRHFGRASHIDFNNPDFVMFAESFGAKGYRVETADELVPTLKQAIADDTVVIIDCPVDYSENMKLTEKLGNLVCSM
ncbi:MAG: acetolactate synthase large subunit [Gemmatimonadetes bacterium]|nr:acetolactate synthase large subunit [Gemmatimonadota bacterium]